MFLFFYRMHKALLPQSTISSLQLWVFDIGLVSISITLTNLRIQSEYWVSCCLDSVSSMAMGHISLVVWSCIQWMKNAQSQKHIPTAGVGRARCIQHSWQLSLENKWTQMMCIHSQPPTSLRQNMAFFQTGSILFYQGFFFLYSNAGQTFGLPNERSKCGQNQKPFPKHPSAREQNRVGGKLPMYHFSSLFLQMRKSHQADFAVRPVMELRKA